MTVPALHSGAGLLNKARRWLALYHIGLRVSAIPAALGPFLTKPFNMDDPLFIWAARRIHAPPGSSYGFDVNWYGNVTEM